jgi:acetyltransferase-like isoleucine patch superfamily enzyme
MNEPITIGGYVKLEVNSIVLQGLCIVVGNIPGSGSYVTKDISKSLISGGLPTNIIRISLENQ